MVQGFRCQGSGCMVVGGHDSAGAGHPFGKVVWRECHPGGNPGANFKSISHICHPILVAFDGS